MLVTIKLLTRNKIYINISARNKHETRVEPVYFSELADDWVLYTLGLSCVRLSSLCTF